MKGILEFNLPEEHEEFQIAVNAMDYRNAIVEMLEDLRRKIKYEEDRYTKEELKVIETIREKFYEIAGYYKLELD